MERGKKARVKWFPTPQDHDYPAAESYITLLFDEETAARFVKRLRHAEVTEFKAKDIFRASGHSLLGVSNSHVKKDQRKIQRGETISPVLLVRDTKRGKLLIADGYHRLCAVYCFNEDAAIPCKIV